MKFPIGTMIQFKNKHTNSYMGCKIIGRTDTEYIVDWYKNGVNVKDSPADIFSFTRMEEVIKGDEFWVITNVSYPSILPEDLFTI